VKLPFLSFTAHSRRNPERPRRSPRSGSRLFLLYHQRGLHNKVYFTGKLLFPHISQHISRLQTKNFPLFYIHFTLSFPATGFLCLPGQLLHSLAHRIGRKQEHTTAGVYLHMTAHITHFKILHGVSLLCVCFVPGAFPGEHSIAQSGYHKKDFHPFLQIFCAKSCVSASGLLTLFVAFAFLSKPAFSENTAFPSAAFPQETGATAAVSASSPPVKKVAQKRPQAFLSHKL
jgi:hypothetical protein